MAENHPGRIVAAVSRSSIADETRLVLRTTTVYTAGEAVGVQRAAQDQAPDKDWGVYELRRVEDGNG